MKKKLNKPLPDYAKYSTIGLTMALIITAGVTAGYFLDQWIVTGFPLFIVIFSIGSVSLAIYYVVRDLLKPKK